MRIGVLAKSGAALFLALLAAPPAIQASCKLTPFMELPVTMEGARPLVATVLNGRPVRLLVDSGAFFSILSPATSAELKLKTKDIDGGMYTFGIGGIVTPRLTTVKDFTIGRLSTHDIEFLVGGSEPGPGAAGVLGENFLGLADAEYDLRGGVVRLFQPLDCKDANLAYWVGPQQAFSAMEIEYHTRRSPHILGVAYVNGIKIRAMFDTGASSSVVSRRTAERLGVKLDGAGVVDGGFAQGFGRGSVRTWIAPFESFKIGDEEVKHTRLRVGETGSTDVDMLLGADFFLSHRIYVANGQRKLYFSYNGGPVFNLTVHPLAADSGAPGESEEAKLDAPGYARRGAAAAARRDFDGAIADLSQAMALDDQNGDYARIRALAYREKGNTVQAREDLDRALTLNPNDVESRLARVQLLLASKDSDGAARDLEVADKVLPVQADQRLEMGELYGRSNDFKLALRQFDRWIAWHPEDARISSALNNRCWFSAVGNYDLPKGLEDCNRVLDRVPNSANLLNSRAYVRLRMGQMDKAIADFNAALKLMPKYAWALYGRGVAERQKGLAHQSQVDVAAATALDAEIVDKGRRFGFEP